MLGKANGAAVSCIVWCSRGKLAFPIAPLPCSFLTVNADRRVMEAEAEHIKLMKEDPRSGGHVVFRRRRSIFVVSAHVADGPGPSMPWAQTRPPFADADVGRGPCERCPRRIRSPYGARARVLPRCPCMRRGG